MSSLLSVAKPKTGARIGVRSMMAHERKLMGC